MPRGLSIWRIAALLILLFAGAELFGCAFQCELDEGGGREHSQHQCLCCCRHAVVGTPALFRPAEAVEMIAPELQPESPAAPKSSVYHPPRS